MEKEKLYHIALDDYEHGVVIRSLNDEKTKLMEEGKSADAVDDLLVKVGNAPLKKFKVIERKRSDEACAPWPGCCRTSCGKKCSPLSPASC